MRTRPLAWCLVLIIAIAVIGVGVTIITGTTPLLGLDLQGGVSVVEKPQGHVTAADLKESQQIINNRVNGLGVSNSNVTVQGNNIVIELPGAKNDTAVLKVVGQTAQLFFRPVDCIIAPYVAPANSSTTTTAPKGGTHDDGQPEDDHARRHQDDQGRGGRGWGPSGQPGRCTPGLGHVPARRRDDNGAYDRSSR